MNDMMNGWMGNRVLVNSTPNAFHHVRRATYRLRIVNGSNARVYDLALSNGQEFTIIGTDGGLLESPIPVRNVRLAPGERLDLLVDFSTSSAGDNVKLVSAPYTAPVEMMSPVYPQGLAMDILTFTVTNETGPVFTPPSKLSEFPALPSLNGLRTRIFSLSMARGMGMGMRPQINGLTYNMERIDFTVVRGEFEIFEFRNTENAMFHPMHVHGRQFRVLSRSGGTLLPTDTGYKDTILVAPNETVRVLVQHSEYTGDFLLHCHNLEHEDEGMMMNYYISEVSSVDDTVESAIDIYPNPASTTVTIRSQAGGYKDLAIYDVSGRTVVTRTDVSNGEQVDIRHLTDGHYTLEYGSIQAALVVQH
jgi:FtsP/CotA-like multicopper oxidase with cupredoxin domain